MAARHTYSTLSRLARRVASHCKSVMAATGTSSDGQIPWFTIRSSRPPSPCTASSTARPAAAGRRNRFTAASVSSASALRLRYPTATPAPACASIRAVARPMPRPPPVTNARFPERSITALIQRGTRNAERGTEVKCRWLHHAHTFVPRSAFPLPRSCVQPLLHHFADQVLDREVHLLDPRGVVRRHDQGHVGQLLEAAARLAQEAHDAHAAGLRRLRGTNHIGAFSARRVEREHVAGPRQGFELAREYFVEAHIVGARREERAVGREGHGAERRPVGLIPHDVLGREMLRGRRAAAVAGEEQRPAGAQGGDVASGDRRDRLSVFLPHPRRQRRQGREPRAGLLGGRHSPAACTSACRSAAEAPRSSSAVPTTTKSAPAARAARTWAGRLIPPPTNNVRSGTAARHARITSAATGRGAPLPASR